MKSTQLKGKGNRPPANACATHKSDLRKVVDKGQDTHFSYNMTVLIGCPAEVTTRSGEKYEGIFVAYSSSQEIMLEAAHLIPSDNDDSAISTHYDVLIIPSDKLMAMKFENAMLNYATRDFQTDSAISSGRVPISVDKELTPWDDGDADPTDDLDLGEVDGGSGRNGWAPGEMFKKNEEKYGVVSSYDQQLSGYTTSLDKSDKETFKKHEEKALQIAEEIEKNTSSTERSNVENGDDEEAKFSAVVRDTRDSVVFNNDSSNYSNLNNNNNNNRVTSSTTEISRTDKYVPPSKRNQNQNQPPPNAQPPPITPPVNTFTSTSAPPQAQNHHLQQQGPVGGGGGNTRKPNYGGQRTFTPSTNSYYQQDARRNNYDRRGPQMQNQYGGASNHGDRDRDRDGGNRPTRGGKGPMDRRGPGPGREDPAKKELMEFSNTFALATADNVQTRRPPPPLVNTGPPQPTPIQTSSNTQQRTIVSQAQNGSNPPPSSALSSSNTRNSQKMDKDKGVAPNAALTSAAPKVDKVEKGPLQNQRPQHQQAPATTAVPEPPPTVTSRKPSESPTEAVTDISSDEKQSPRITSSPAPSESRSNTSDAKSIDSPDSRKPFTFNVNAKEFNPTTKSFTPRSPATPPRPPSTPASTPQLIPAMAQGHPSYIMPPTAIYLAPQYSQAISPVANSNISATNLQPHRHMNPHNNRKGMGVSQRADLSPAIPVQAAGPLLAQGSLQSNGPNNHHYAAYSIPHGYAQQVRIHAPGLVQMYNSDVGGEGNPIHIPLQYIHGGAAAGGHGPTQATVNVSGQNQIIPGSPHGYTQNGGSHGPHQHHLYPFVGVPVVGVGYPHGPNPLLNQRNYFEQ